MTPIPDHLITLRAETRDRLTRPDPEPLPLVGIPLLVALALFAFVLYALTLPEPSAHVGAAGMLLVAVAALWTALDAAGVRFVAEDPRPEEDPEIASYHERRPQ